MNKNSSPLIALTILVILFINGCSIQPNETIELSADNELIYSGKINSKNFTKLKRVYEEAATKPSLLKITSSGGSAKIGMDMGNWIQSHGISVEITTICASSCANYIFPAGKQKILGKHALLLLHEGPYQADIAAQIESIYGGDNTYVKGANFNADKDGVCNVKFKGTPEKTLAIIEETKGLDCIDKTIESSEGLQPEESSFYLSLGIDPNYPYYGQNDKRYIGKDNLYYYSLDSLKVMGFGNILLKDKQWAPQQSPAYRESLFLVEPNFSAFANSAAQLGMNKFQRFINDKNTILPSHQTWFYRDSELLAKHESIVAMSSNRALEKALLAKLKNTNYGLQDHPVSIFCGLKECEIQITYLGSFAEFRTIDWKTIIGNTPKLKFFSFNARQKTGVGIIVIVNFSDA